MNNNDLKTRFFALIWMLIIACLIVLISVNISKGDDDVDGRRNSKNESGVHIKE